MGSDPIVRQLIWVAVKGKFAFTMVRKRTTNNRSDPVSPASSPDGRKSNGIAARVTLADMGVNTPLSADDAPHILHY